MPSRSHNPDDEAMVQLPIIGSAKIAEGDSDLDEKESASEDNNKYAIHPVFLQFRDAEVEQRFFKFLYRDSGFVGGKVYSIMFVGAAVAGYLTYPRGPFGGPDATVGDVLWILHHIGTVGGFIFIAVAWMDRFWEWRELAFVLLSLVHWPGVMIIIWLLKYPHAYHLNQGICCVFLCAFTTQARISRQIINIGIVPMLTMLVVFLLASDYFQEHTYAEMLYWPLMVFPITLLHILEKRTRRSFQEKEVAELAIEAIERKTLVTRNMIVRFFPPTPTKDLLKPDSGYSKFYRSTALIATDIVGFTSYASRIDASDVIDMLTALFRSIDNVASQYDVEKVSTIGDAYFGAVFPSSQDKNEIAASCSNLMCFGCAILDFAEGLKMRIGVHVGDVVGGFVGKMPPKFDLFGRAVERVQLMESSAPHGSVHASQEVLDTIGDAGRPLGVINQTEHGMSCTQWMHSDNVAYLRLVEADDEKMCDHRAEAIVETLVKMHTADFDASLKSPAQSGGRPSGARRSSSSKIENAIIEVDPEIYKFHILFLRFHDPRVERCFVRMIRSNKINDAPFKIGILAELAILLGHISMGCFDTHWDRAATCAIVLILLLMDAYISVVGTNSRLHALVTYSGFVGIFVAAMLFLRAECENLENQPYYVGTIIYMYWTFAIMNPQFIFDVQFTIRLGLGVLTFAIGVFLQLVVRNAWVNDGSTPLDVYPVFLVFSGSCISYVTDFILRTAFGSKLRLSRFTSRARGKQAVMMNRALDIMLPKFVTERIIQKAKKASSGTNDVSDTASQSTATTASSHDVAAVDFSNVSQVWDYAHVCVMFATFTFEGAEVDYSQVRRTINDMEDVVTDHGALKVKTIGSTMMCVLGIHQSLNPSQMIVKMITVARALQVIVFRPLADKKQGTTYKIGINSGPCFGAVLGDDGFIFDIFGDTVNVASRMMSTACNATIQLSARAQETLPIDQSNLRFSTVALAPIEVKGKGSLKVHVVTDRDFVLVEDAPGWVEPQQSHVEEE